MYESYSCPGCDSIVSGHPELLRSSEMRNRAHVISINQIGESQVGLGGQIVLVQIAGGNRVAEALRKLTAKCQRTTKSTVCNRGERIKNLREPQMFEPLIKESEG